MTPWIERSREERGLLNPSFCATILWHAASGYATSGKSNLSFAEAFLILPFVLHRDTREGIPRTTKTSLVVWLEENPLARGHIASRAQVLVPFTKEALIFASSHRFIQIENGKLRAITSWKKQINVTMKESSDEVKECIKAAEFVGRWLSLIGNDATVLAILGIRP